LTHKGLSGSFLRGWYEDWSGVLARAKVYFPKYMEENPQIQVKTGQNCQKSRHKCPECSEYLLERKGKFGKYYLCSSCQVNYSVKKLTALKSIEKSRKSGIKCPECGADMAERKYRDKKTKKMKKFWGCSKFPECKGAIW